MLGRRPDDTRWVDIDRHPDARSTSGVVVLRPEGGLLYVNADNVHAAVRAEMGESVSAVVLDLESVPVIDLTAARMLADLREEIIGLGLRLAIARDIGQVRDLLEHGGATDLLDEVFPTVDAAVRSVRSVTPDP